MVNLPECVHALNVRNTGRFMRHDFIVVGASADRAAPLLVGAVLEGCRLFINDHRRDDSEGGLIFKRINGALQRMTGGHGYSSPWSVVSEVEAIAETAATLHATRWGALPGGGHFEIPNNQMSSANL